MKSFYKLPENLGEDIATYKAEVESFLNGKIHPTEFRGKRVPRGIYEQRANDTFMMRIRIPAGGITPVQMRKISELSKQYGNGILHITTRQDVQIHYVNLQDTPRVMSELMEVGLTTKGGGGNTVRNITGCYDSGVCEKEIFDVSPYAIALTESLIKDPRSYTLPRKFKIAFSGCGSDCSFATVNDVGFIAAEKSDNGAKEFGFRVYVAGGMGAGPRVAEKLEDFIPLKEVGNVARAIKNLFDKHGNRKNKHKARLRFLYDKVGREEFIKLYKEEYKIIKESKSIDLDIKEIMPPSKVSEQSSGKTGENLEDEVYKKWLSQNVVPQKQENYFIVKVFLELGDISADHIEKLAEVAKDYSKGSIRSTQGQNLVFRWIKKEELYGLYEKLKNIGLNKAGSKTIGDITCCAGASTCRLGICLSRGLAGALREELLKNEEKIPFTNNLNIKISGCPNACGQDPIGQIGFIGAARRTGEKMVPHYMVSLGGRVEEGKTAFGKQIGLAPSKNMPDVLLKFLKDFNSSEQNQDFYGYLENKGKTVMQSILEDYKSTPAYEENKDYYSDWGADEEFSLAGRGPGECGAGVFDMMEVDLKEAKEALEKAAKKIKSNDNPAKELYHSISRSSRVLLVTRGAEAKNDIEAFESFENLFINAGLVDKKFRKLMFLAIEYKNGDLKEEALNKNYDFIKDFATTVADLYDSMDDSLQFKKEKKMEKTTDSEQKRETPLLDLKGVKCPFNYVKAKLKLETMETDNLLEIYLDDGEPIENVPKSLKNDGQEILEMEKMGERHYRLLIKKKA